MTFVVGGHASGKQSRGLRTDTRDLKIQDCEDVDSSKHFTCHAFKMEHLLKTGPLNPDQYEVNDSLTMRINKKVFFVVTKLKLI